MLKIEDLEKIALYYADDLREYRLSGDLKYLLPIIEEAINSNNGYNITDFYNSLTENEKKALIAIRDQIGSQGNISIVKMIQKTNLSRPVWTSLLQKMEKYNIAQIKNQGVKGTYIEIMENLE